MWWYSEQWRRMWSTVRRSWQEIHSGRSSPAKRYLWVRKECPIRKRQSTISSRRLSRQDHIEHPNAGCTACNLFSDCSDQKSDHCFLTYCFMIGRKSVNGNGMLIFRPFRAVLAALSASSLPRIPTWLGTQQNTTSFCRVLKVECSSKILRKSVFYMP